MRSPGPSSALRGCAIATGFWALVGASGCSAPERRVPLEPSRGDSLTLPFSGGARGAGTALDFAWAQVGKRYCWGGTGPTCFDCSGLVQRAWGEAGVRLPRTADAIASELPEVPLDALRAGDILWWPGHVGLYAGGGWVVEALDRRHGVVSRPAMRPHRAFRPSG
jgi:cell wall-associated NlpC family hydrolase